MSDVRSRSVSPAMMPATRMDWIDMLPLMFLAVFAVLILGAPARINHDCAYVIQCAQLLTMGKLPYVDFIDVNPPLIFYINMLPVYAADVTGVTLPQAFSFFVLGQVTVSSMFLWYLYRLRTLNLRPPARFALLLSWMLSSFYVYSTGDFGQRDFLVILLSFPFLIIRIIRYYDDPVPLGLAVVIGLFTGMGLSLKPNFFFIVLIPEFIALARTRSFRRLFAPEVLGAVAFGSAYLLHFFFLPENVRAELFGRWMPFFIQYYGTINLNLFQHVLKQPAVIAGIIALAVVFVLGFVIVRRRGTSSLRIEMLIGGVIGSFLSYWVQQKGYSYHAVPAKISFVILTLFSAFWFYDEVMNRKERFPFRRTIALWPSVLIVCSLAAVIVRSTFADKAYTNYDYFEPYRHAIRAHSVKNGHILFINTILFPAYPTLVQTEQLPGSRYLTSFPLGGFYYSKMYETPFVYRSPESLPPEERQFLRELADDIRTNKPAIIFIFNDGETSGMPAGFEMLTYFKKVRFIETAMTEYVFKEKVLAFAMYLRKPEPKTIPRDQGRQRL